MNKRVKDIGKNLGSLSAIEPAKLHKTAANDLVVDYQNYDEYVLDLLSKIYQKINFPHEVRQDLARLKSMFQLDIPLSFRPPLFHQLNSLLGSLMNHYANDLWVFKSCFAMMTAFKRQIDLTPQPSEELAELEWDALQKTVYLMCDWEAQVLVTERAPLNLDETRTP